MSETAAPYLHWVGQELATTLKDARNALEQYAEDTSQVDHLTRCADLMHSGHGALHMVEIYGAALLAEEMVHVVQGLQDGDIRDPGEAMESLSNAMVQLPVYLDRVLNGGRDVPLVLLPLLNDLRAVRGGALLSESSLFVLKLSNQRPIDNQVQPTEPSGEDIRYVARRLRPRYQAGLIGFIRGEQVDSSLATMAVVAQALEQAATDAKCFQFWWVSGAVIEALREEGLETGASIKRLLGQVDRELKRVIDLGENEFAIHSPPELLDNLLYYVARAVSSGDRVVAVKSSFSLSELMPEGDQPAADESISLSAPSATLMRTVAEAIRQDLGSVKDVLDIHVRTGGGDPAPLQAQPDVLRKIANTLAMLGLDGLGDETAEQIVVLTQFLASNEQDDAPLLRVAEALLTIEDRLDAQLLDVLKPGVQPSDDDEESDFRKVAGAVLRECMVNLARVKEAISTYVAQPEPAHTLDSIPTLLTGINAGLLMLDKPRAVDVLGRIGACLASTGDKPISAIRLDQLADAIVSVEYYMETLQNGRKDPWYMLDNAERCLDVLGVAPIHDDAQALDVALEASGDAQAERHATGTHRASARAAGDEPVDTPATVTPVSDIRLAGQGSAAAVDQELVVDPELLELFIDEAKDEIESLRDAAPKWSEAPEQREGLLNLRRSLHTLKGSGRMVGGHRIADFSWALEKLLNKVIDGTQPAGPAVVVLVNAAVGVLPELVEQLEIGTEPTADIDGLMAQADRLANAPPRPGEMSSGESGIDDDAEVAETSAIDEAEAAGEPAAEAGAGMDPVLYEIFSTESAEHLATVDAWIDACEGANAPYPVTPALHRACHTLSGTANTAAVDAAAALARPLDRYIAKHYESDVDLPADAVGLMRSAADAIRQIVEQIGVPGGVANQHPELVASIVAMEQRFDDMLADQQGQMAALAVADDADPVSAVDAAAQDAGAAANEPAIASAPHLQAVDDTAGTLSDDADFDAEIAAIFGDEATELLDAGDNALQQLAQRPDNPHVIAELQRHLHTLKGGARMAGITAMGNLSHELESLVRDIGEGLRPATSGTIALLQASVDRLHGMRDALAAGLPVVEAEDVLGRIAALCGRDTAPAVESGAGIEPPGAAKPIADEAATPTETAGKDESALHDEHGVDTQAAEDAEVVVASEEAVHEESADTERSEVQAPVSAAEETAAVDEPDAAETVEANAGTAKHSDADEAAHVAAAAASATEPFEPEPAGPEFAPVADATPVVSVDTAPRPADERAADRQDVARVSAALLDDLLNNAGEISIYHSRLEQQISSISFNLSELTQTVTRLRGQLRQMEIETEAQMLFRHQADSDVRDEFDPLELDRYSTVQQLSRALAESVSDLSSIEDLLGELAHDAGTLLVQQSRVTTELQDGLMRTRMVPFQRHVSRLSRLVRRTAAEAGKQAELRVEGASGELDRQVLERMLPPLEHMLRNAVVHGIETPGERQRKGKSGSGEIVLRLHREGSQMVLELADDGAGLDVAAISRRAKSRGMLKNGDALTETDILQFIVEPGFSTARELTQTAGRGVGMDVVANEVRQLGGTLEIGPDSARGAHFIIRLPQTLAITQALLVRTGEDTYAIPLPSVEGIVRVPRGEIESYLGNAEPAFEYGGQRYRFAHVGALLGGHPTNLEDAGSAVPVILVRAGEHSTALIADEMLGSREVVVKPVGPQIAGIRGIAGATILGDGSIIIILDVSALVRTGLRAPAESAPAQARTDDRRLVMVIDDSITVRRVTQRLLERNDIRVITAKDGVDAVSLLQEHEPDLMLLDIEMPRMDGYEVATHVRNSPRLQHIPIVMVTSRVGDKHRARAFELGVDAYLGKPYQEAQLLETLEPLLTRCES